MSAQEFLKKALLYFPKKAVNRGFVLPPRNGLRLFMKLGIDISAFSVPYFLAHNLGALWKLFVLRLQGQRPAIIYWTNESDGRFDWIGKFFLEKGYTKSIWFCFPIPTIAQEYFYFESYDKKGCGFYEDARLKYIEPSNRENRLNYQKFCEGLLSALERWTGSVDFFLSGSNNDRWVVEMITVAQRKGTDWIVCEREGTGTHHSYRREGEWFRKSKSIQAHYIFTANEMHRKMFEYAKLPSVRSVESLGELDTDFWFHWDRKFTRKQYREWDRYKKKVLFLTFGLRNYIEPNLYPGVPEFNWKTILSESEEALFDFAREHRDILVFYKMGHKEDNNEAFIRRCRDAGLVNVVCLDRSFPCSELILYSDLIVGFQTTAMFEAMFSDAPLIFLYWAIPSHLDPEKQLLPLHDSGACITVRSKEAFRETLGRFGKGDPSVSQIGPEMAKRRVATREIMFQQADGRVAERYFKRINELIDERRRNPALKQQPILLMEDLVQGMDWDNP